MRCRRFARILLAQAVILMLVSTTVSAQALFKWVDENGIVRYGDVLPNDRIGKEYQILTPDGRVIKSYEAAKSAEQIRQERAARRRQEKEARIQAEINARMAAIQEHHDNVLLMTYTNEQEIGLARDERLDVINSVINLLRKNIETEKAKLLREEKIAKELYLDRGLQIPGGQAQKIEYFTEKVLSKQQHLTQKLEERDKINRQYHKDLIRYRELVEQKKREDEARARAQQEAEEKALYQ